MVINGCAVKPPAVPICTEITPIKGYCVNTLTADEFVVDDAHPFEGKTWWEARPTMLHVPATSWVKIKEFIIKICKKSNKCDSEITGWDRSVDSIDKQLSSKER